MARYKATDTGFVKETKQDITPLSNFTARIEQETRLHDASCCETILTISGKLGKEPLPTIDVNATSFANLGWIATNWGMKPIIMNEHGVMKDITLAMQILSDPKTIDVYKHTGWTEIEKKAVYLHAGGGITENGNNPKITVKLPADIQRYRFTDDHATNPRTAFRASLNLANVGPRQLTWPMLLSTYRAAIGPADYALHVSGRTGTFKSEVASLFQSHYGIEMDARHLPGNWSSTSNALEALAYYAANALFVIDDFVPNGTAWQVRGLQKNADQIIRGQGNQAGRARLTDTSRLQETYYPRGIILSTGEDIPDGHSIRARMMIIDLTPGDIDSETLKVAQERRPMYQLAMMGWIKWIAKNLNAIQRETKAEAAIIRDQFLDIGHSRTPPILGEMIATANLLIKYGLEMKYITMEEAHRITSSAEKACLAQAREQTFYLNESDPATALPDVVRQLLASHMAHVRDRDGSAPEYPDKCGWIEMMEIGKAATYKTAGPLLGWTDWRDNIIYIDINSLPVLKRHAQGKLSMSKQTLFKRLKDAGLLMRTDQARQRNTVRVTCQGHTRHVIALDLAKTLESEEE